MSRRLLLSLVLALACALSASADTKVHLGGLVQLNAANLSANQAFKARFDDPPWEPKPMSRLGVGAIIELELSPTLSVLSGASAIGKGAKLTGSEDYDGFRYEMDFRLNYWETPLFVKYSFGSMKIRPFVLTGPIIGFHSSSDFHLEYLSDTESDSGRYKLEGMKRFDLGFGVGAGVVVPMNRLRLFVAAQYMIGLSNALDPPLTISFEDDETERVVTDPDASLKNKGFRIVAGVTFGLRE